MNIVERMQRGKHCIIGMVHCPALPGTFKYGNDMEAIINKAVEDAIALEHGGVDAIMVENGCDAPSAEKLDIAQVAALSAVAKTVRDKVSIPIGIDATFNDYKAGIAIALAAGGSFIRCPVFVDTVVSGVGIMQPCNREAVLYRRFLGAEHIKIFADVQVKHSFMLNPNIPIEESARWAKSRGADAIIVSGSSTGMETSIEQVARVKKAVDLPVVVGSGITVKNIKTQLTVADGAIVGSAFKKNSIFENPVEVTLVKAIMDAIKN